MKFEFDNGNTCVHMAGDFTFTDHTQFKVLVTRLFEEKHPIVTIDLSQLNFIDSAGLGMLLLARDQAEKTSGKLILRSATGQVKRMFGLTKFDTLFALED